MDESPDHKPTLIKRGMGVHLNHPITAQRGIRNSRPARWWLRKPHPLSRGRTARERIEQVKELAPIASNGPRLGGSGPRLTKPLGTGPVQLVPGGTGLARYTNRSGSH
jgi:hypothetical protein